MTNVEIERKFKVTEGWDVPADASAVCLRQAYLSPLGADIEIRVRAKGSARVMTVKASDEEGDPLVRREVEFEIDDVFAQLWELAREDRLSKRRWKAPLDGATAEVDVYDGALAGLRVVEVEFDSVDAARAFEPPDWFGDELTGAPAWSNRELAAAGRRPAPGTVAVPAVPGAACPPPRPSGTASQGHAVRARAQGASGRHHVNASRFRCLRGVRSRPGGCCPSAGSRRTGQ
ncbi:CYTH domain-containing protein [Streptomyces sp. NPDC054834]